MGVHPGPHRIGRLALDDLAEDTRGCHVAQCLRRYLRLAVKPSMSLYHFSPRTGNVDSMHGDDMSRLFSRLHYSLLSLHSAVAKASRSSSVNEQRRLKNIRMA